MPIFYVVRRCLRHSISRDLLCLAVASTLTILLGVSKARSELCSDLDKQVLNEDSMASEALGAVEVSEANPGNNVSSKRPAVGEKFADPDQLSLSFGGSFWTGLVSRVFGLPYTVWNGLRAGPSRDSDYLRPFESLFSAPPPKKDKNRSAAPEPSQAGSQGGADPVDSATFDRSVNTQGQAPKSPARATKIAVSELLKTRTLLATKPMDYFEQIEQAWRTFGSQVRAPLSETEKLSVQGLLRDQIVSMSPQDRLVVLNELILNNHFNLYFKALELDSVIVESLFKPESRQQLPVVKIAENTELLLRILASGSLGSVRILKKFIFDKNLAPTIPVGRISYVDAIIMNPSYDFISSRLSTDFVQYFERKRGYEPWHLTPYFAALAGRSDLVSRHGIWKIQEVSIFIGTVIEGESLLLARIFISGQTQMPSLYDILSPFKNKLETTHPKEIVTSVLQSVQAELSAAEIRLIYNLNASGVNSSGLSTNSGSGRNPRDSAEEGERLKLKIQYLKKVIENYRQVLTGFH